MAITADTRFGKIYKLPEFRENQQALHIIGGLTDRLMSLITIRQLGKLMKVWDPDSMAEGVQHLSELAKEQEVFFDIYTEDEKRQNPSKADTKLISFPLLNRKGKTKCAFICAGGGYGAVCTIIEAFPIAKKLNEAGIAAFVVKYRYGKAAAAPNPMEDLMRAVRFAAEHSGKLNVDISSYAVMGFSAGGNLAAAYAVPGLHFYEHKPGAVILGYPVISMGELTHKESREFLLGKHPSEAEKVKYSVEKQVDENYPPTFIWQFENDDVVSIENTRMMADALERNNVRYVYKTYPGSYHGVGVGVNTVAYGWLD